MAKNNVNITVSFRTPIQNREKIEDLAKERNENLSDTINRIINIYFELLSDFGKSGDKNE